MPPCSSRPSRARGASGTGPEWRNRPAAHRARSSTRRARSASASGTRRARSASSRATRASPPRTTSARAGSVDLDGPAAVRLNTGPTRIAVTEDDHEARIAELLAVRGSGPGGSGDPGGAEWAGARFGSALAPRRPGRPAELHGGPDRTRRHRDDRRVGDAVRVAPRPGWRGHRAPRGTRPSRRTTRRSSPTWPRRVPPASSRPRRRRRGGTPRSPASGSASRSGRPSSIREPLRSPPATPSWPPG